MSFTAPEERPYPYYRAPGSSHGAPAPGSATDAGASPDNRLNSSGGGGGGSYSKGTPAPDHSPQQGYHPEMSAPPGSAHGYPPQPMTPLSGSAGYPPQPQSAGGNGGNGGAYYAMTPAPESAPLPGGNSPPPPTNNSRPVSQNFTAEGLPIVPVGVSGGKMFRCRGYGDCDKVFTRSEHLARHVRKHTGERPFPCHCGKAFSRLDNLRQHAATVHAEQPSLNDQMLTSLAPIHAALSQRASKEQRRRGEIVEVPKNAIERPRHAEYRAAKASPANGAAASQNGAAGGSGGHSQQNSPYTPYHEGQPWGQQPPPHSRPRTGGSGYDYPYQDGQAGDDAGPSRRPGSASGYGYSSGQYYDGGRPPTAPGTASSQESMGQLPYPYRPMSSQGRDIPVPSHYAESEPPSTAHGPPQSPLYGSAAVPGQQPGWSSPPPPGHGAYPPHDAAYPPAEGYSYPGSHGHGSYPPREEVYEYPPTSAGWQTGYGSAPPQSAGAGSQSGGYPAGSGYANPPESPFQYNVPAPGGAGSGEGAYAYPASGGYDRKRRAEDDGEGSGSRKHPRSSSHSPVASANLYQAMDGAPPAAGSGAAGPRDANWLPPASERRSSLAISALLGSPPRGGRGSRPQTAEGAYDKEDEIYEKEVEEEVAPPPKREKDSRRKR
ncbi:hypothetical protein IAT38_000982 [Cryptococcus sp. DSM 104549]